MSAQKPTQVTHIEGTEVVNGISITVTHKGKIALLDDLSYCNGETGPYYFGYSYVDGISAFGSYTFTFDPPVKEVIVNITGLSGDEGNMEEVKFFINGVHYAIPYIGTKINCEELAVLTPKGNVRPCRGCSISGWKGTKIEGPISTLTVTDSIINGGPAGSLIALFVGDPDLTNNTYSAINRVKLKDLLAGKCFTIESDFNDQTIITLTDKTDNLISINYDKIDDHHACIAGSEILLGTYIVTIVSGDQTDLQKIIVE